MRRTRVLGVKEVQMYQAVSAQAAAIHEMFVGTLGTIAGVDRLAGQGFLLSRLVTADAVGSLLSMR